MVVTLYSGITEKCITQKPSGKSRKTNKKQDKIEEFNNFEGSIYDGQDWLTKKIIITLLFKDLSKTRDGESRDFIKNVLH